MFKENVKKLLEEKGVKLGTMASKLGISYSTMDSMINGTVDEANIGVDKVIKIANFLNVSVEELYGYESKEDPEISGKEMELLRLWREATPEAQVAAKMTLEANKKPSKKEKAM